MDSDVVPLRFGLKYSPIKLALEYKRISTGKKYTATVTLNKIENIDELVDKILIKLNKYLPTTDASRAQVRSLVERARDEIKDKESINSKSLEGHKDITLDPIVLSDLQKVDPEILTKAKEKMAVTFEANFIPPSDERYIHDKAIDFGEPLDDNEWDEDE